MIFYLSISCHELHHFIFFREKVALDHTTEKISAYEKMFDQLKKMTGTDRLEEVCGRL